MTRHTSVPCPAHQGGVRFTAFQTWVLLTVIITAAAIAFSGCSTVARGVRQFRPVPRPSVEAQELEPLNPPSATDVLRAANEAFLAGNAAQEKGDQEEALRQYTHMLELLIQADLNPAIFYNLRNEFENILTSTEQQAALYERLRPSERSELALGKGIQSELEIEFPLHERILVEIDEIQKLYPKNFQNGLNRSTKYMPYLRSELAKAGLPPDLAWLAMVESQYTPRIISRAGAGGMWQFMRTTGSRYHLRIDSVVDERFQWQKSTAAAIALLSDLYSMFDSWPLAISAYNMGEYGLERAIADNGGERNLWVLLDTEPASYRIPLETKKFYAKLIASIIVGKNPQRYGFTLDPQPPEVTVAVPTYGRYALADLDKACGLPDGAIEALNPHLIRGETPADAYEVMVPVDMRAKVAAALQELPKLTASSYASAKTGEESSGSANTVRASGTHTVRKGETLGQIADKYGVSEKELMKLNGLRSAKRLQAGRKLVLPGGARGGGESQQPEPSASGEAKTYKVKRGDTLFEIAKAHKVTPEDIQAWNHLDKRAHIQAGQTLYVSSPKQALGKLTGKSGKESTEAETAQEQPKEESKSDAGEKVVHTVRGGEYLAKIAKQYSVSIDDILKWNDLAKNATIRVGDKLTIYTNGAPKEAEKPEEEAIQEAAPIENGKDAKSGDDKAASKGQPAGTVKKTHKIEKGETASSIASKYGVKISDLLAWNGMTPKSIIRVGDDLTIYVADEKAPKSEPEKPAKKEPEKAAAPEEKPDEVEAAPAPEEKKEEASKEAPAKEEAQSAPAEPQGEKITHTVGQGQNPTTIARRYGVSLKELFAWNGWTKAPVLNVGDQVIVYKK